MSRFKILVLLLKGRLQSLKVANMKHLHTALERLRTNIKYIIYIIEHHHTVRNYNVNNNYNGFPNNIPAVTF